jgi:hypothetical protein
MGTKGFASFRNRLNRMERSIERDSRQIPRQVAAVGTTRMKRELIENDAVATTELWRSIGWDRISPTAVKLFADADYAGYVEKGTGKRGDGTYKTPSNVPVDEIFKWMQAKPSFVGEVSIPVAHIIAKKLEENGQASQPFFGPAWNLVEREFKRQLRESLSDAF